MKKTLILLAVLLLAVMFVLPSFAESATATTSSISGNRGKTVTLTVSLAKGVTVGSGSVFLTYDANVLELVSGKWNVSDTILSNFDMSKNKGAFAFMDKKSISGNIFTATFKIKSNAEFGEYAVKMEVQLKDGSGADFTVTNNSGKVTVKCSHSYSEWGSTGTSSHKRTCSSCGAVETKAHTFSNDCDTTCNDCKFTRTTTHKYETKWSKNQNSHWHECSECGDKKDEAKHIPGAPATETSAQTCTVCQYIIAEPLGHTHKFGDTWEKNENGHWHKCSSCGEPSEVEEHVYQNDCDTTCDTCGFERKITHKYSEEFKSDDAGHWNVCEVCGGKSESQKHVHDNDCDTECNTCGHERTVEHKYDNGKVTVAPTKDKNGEKTYTCTECKHEKKVELELYEATVTPEPPVSTPTPVPTPTPTPETTLPQTTAPVTPGSTAEPVENNNTALAVVLLFVGLVVGGGAGVGVMYFIGKKKKV